MAKERVGGKTMKNMMKAVLMPSLSFLIWAGCYIRKTGKITELQNHRNAELEGTPKDN